MNNKYLEFYGEHNISPVHQNVDGLQKRRKNLYRQLGIPWQCLTGKEVLEFGPGGGMNALALLEGGIGHIDLIEPNRTGREEIEELYSLKGISKNRYDIFPDIMEDYKADKQYDFVIAEMFIMHLENWKDCLRILKKYCKRDSIVITTCADEIGFYVERIKRYIAHYSVRNIAHYEQKRDCLIEMFEPQIRTLGAGTRTAKDWVEDQLFNEATLCEHLMNMKDAITEFEDDFEILGASQNIFTDYSWYKDVDYDYIREYKKQYDRKKHMLLLAGEDNETIRSIEANEKLWKACSEVNLLIRKQEMSNEYNIDEMKVVIEKVSQLADNLVIADFNHQSIEILERLQYGTVDLTEYPLWCKCFGKSSQYISFVKR